MRRWMWAGAAGAVIAIVLVGVAMSLRPDPTSGEARQSGELEALIDEIRRELPGDGFEFALNVFSMQYLADFTDDPAVIEEIVSQHWIDCATPFIGLWERIPAEHRGRTALRMRARDLVVQAGGVAKNVSIDAGAEPVGQWLYPLKWEPVVLR